MSAGTAGAVPCERLQIKFITIGGTIDKIYFDRKSEFRIGDPQVVEILKDVSVIFA